ncbi:hypothetical protein SSP35_18_00780 [Streptomyces sp. NBRC 110611]|uniref:DUF3574 domain-containing protein n=1 Tax=Streptomyces sp. NBRC 110611 TaxID=1621259 RepID=UPI00082CC552|nr:DUF3574 domain-containing protein [Streptomyces sp. NBRC 110611]GAU70350.1 hypothetical protein SSP35_18_00780 [Streptomyces sp. NBRC 110611]
MPQHRLRCSRLRHARVRLAVLAVSTALLGAAATASAPAVTPTPARASAPAAAPASVPVAQPPQAVLGDPYVETSLLFGTAHADGSPPVTDRQFRRFVDEFVTPRFPEGLTVQQGQGQYRDAHGAIERERSYELILWYPLSRKGPSGRKIEEIRSAYTQRFGQESVARADHPISVDF